MPNRRPSPPPPLPGNAGNVTTLNSIEGCSAVVMELRATVTPGTMPVAPAPAPMPVEAPLPAPVPAPAPAPSEPEWPKLPVKPYPNTPGVWAAPLRLVPASRLCCAS
jgi:hypothetical protein